MICLRKQHQQADRGIPVLVRFTPPSGGVPYANGKALSGETVGLMPNALRQCERACRPKELAAPWYVWLKCFPSRPKLSRRGIRHIGCYLDSLASKDDIEGFIDQWGEPKPEVQHRAKSAPRSARRKPHGSQRRYKRPAYADHAEEKPSS